MTVQCSFGEPTDQDRTCCEMASDQGMWNQTERKHGLLDVLFGCRWMAGIAGWMETDRTEALVSKTSRTAKRCLNVKEGRMPKEGPERHRRLPGIRCEKRQ